MRTDGRPRATKWCNSSQMMHSVTRWAPPLIHGDPVISSALGSRIAFRICWTTRCSSFMWSAIRTATAFWVAERWVLPRCCPGPDRSRTTAVRRRPAGPGRAAPHDPAPVGAACAREADRALNQVAVCTCGVVSAATKVRALRMTLAKTWASRSGRHSAPAGDRCAWRHPIR